MKKQEKRMRLTAVIILAVFLVSGVPAACGRNMKKDTYDKPYTIGVVTKSADSEYWMSVCSGMEKAAKDYGAEVRIVSPDSESNDKMQKRLIHDLIQKGVDALAVSPVQSHDIEYLKDAEEKQILVAAYDTKILKEGIPYIGIDNYKAGRELAKVMAEKLNGQGKAGIVTGDLRQTAHAERLEGIQDYIKQHTEIEISFIESGYSNLLMSEAEISGIFAQYPDTAGIFATSAVTALGIMQYLKNRPVHIMTVDAQQDAVEAVSDGSITALAAQSGFEIGYETVKYIVEHKNSTVFEDKILDAEIITKQNVGKWKEQDDISKYEK